MAERKTSGSDGRARDWTFVGYPESLPENWVKVLLEEFQVKGIISPLHDKDRNEDPERTPKKPHYHVILRYGGKKSYSQIKEITDRLGQPSPEPVRNIEGAVRYLIHADNPEKAQYKREDIRTLGAIDLDVYFKLSKSDQNNLTREILDYIRENDVVEFCDLMDYAIENDSDWFDYLNHSAWTVEKYISSRRNKKQQAISTNTIAKALSQILYGEIK